MGRIGISEIITSEDESVRNHSPRFGPERFYGRNRTQACINCQVIYNVSIITP